MKNNVIRLMLCVLLALLCPLSLSRAQQPLRTWSATFDKIHDSDILQKLYTYKKQGWETAFRSTKKNAQQLRFEGEQVLHRLEAAIARDRFLLTRTKSPETVSPTDEQCKAALNDIHNVFFPSCDKHLRQEQLLAVSGILELLGDYEELLPQVVYTGRYGKNLGEEVVAKVTLRVVKAAPPKSGTLHIITFADDKRVVEVPQGENIIVQMIANGKRVLGFVVKPATGVLEAPKGTVHFSIDRFMVFKTVSPGEATIEFIGPLQKLLAAESSQYFCTECWSGYVVGGGPFFGVQAAWVVPKVATEEDPSAYGQPYGSSSTWVGLDGVGVAQLIQTGTSQTYSDGFLGIGRGAYYEAWWQVLPQYETQQSINFTVLPGDCMGAAITPTPGFTPTPNANSSWDIELWNRTQGWTSQSTQTFNGPLASAEWIEEDPSDCFIGYCWRQSFANYEKVWFDLYNRVWSGNANRGFWVSPNLSTNDKWSINQDNQIFSTPSDPDGDGDGFYVKYSAGAPEQVNPPGPQILTTTLGPATVNQAYSQRLDAFVEWTCWEPGSPVWSWSIASGALPQALSLDSSSGTISGTPTVPGTSTFSVVAKDVNTGAFSKAQSLSIQVLSNPASTLEVDCGNVYPSGSMSVAVDRAAVQCGVPLTYTPGQHVVSATVSGTGGQYIISYGSPCNSSSGLVTLQAGKVAVCFVSATQKSSIEDHCPSSRQKCCEPSDNGCTKCVTPPKVCP